MPATGDATHKPRSRRDTGFAAGGLAVAGKARSYRGGASLKRADEPVARIWRRWLRRAPDSLPH